MKMSSLSKLYLFPVFLMLFSSSGCGGSARGPASVNKNSTVLIEYVASLSNGAIFDSTSDEMPKKIDLNSRGIVEGLRKALIGMKKGETKTVIVNPEDGYGLRDENKKTIIPEDKIPSNFVPEEGKVLRMQLDDGTLLIGIVIQVLPDGIELDINHLLAGKELIYNIKVLDIE